MAKPRKVLTKTFKAEILKEIKTLHEVIDTMKTVIESEEKVNNFLSILHGLFSKIELKILARQKEVKNG